ncbi:DEKNAAC105611 [Brettanomyces naardenensis]|uniref:DEKNAAC105611 n=1 Tax=Brettanomyces naardenensis TaxID=13370 RepID=A0A448YTS6_BRENA|nr:DEKNAAC105611 [Brettanomyces naardenensis]
MNIAELPVEVWGLITKDLETSDVVNLMAGNRRLYSILQSDVIWKDIVEERWYKDILPVQKPLRSPDKECYSIFQTRSRIDRELNILIDSIVSKNRVPLKGEVKRALVSRIERIFYSDSYLFIPELLRIRNHLSIKSLNAGKGYLWKDKEANLRARLNDARRVYIASVFLEALQFESLFRLFTQVFLKGRAPSSVEAFLTEFNLIDPNYFELAPLRQETIYRTIEIYHENAKSFESIGSTLRKIVTIIGYLFRAIAETSMKYPQRLPPLESESHIGSIEDTLILRNYCGDSSMQPFNVNAMVQEVCSRLGFHVRINALCIEAKNDDGKTFIIIAGGPHITIRSPEELPDRFSVFEGTTAYCRFILETMYGSSFDRTVYGTRGILHPERSFAYDKYAEVNTAVSHRGTGIGRQILGTSFVRDSSQTIVQRLLSFIMNGCTAEGLTKLIDVVDRKRLPIFTIMLKYIIRVFDGRESLKRIVNGKLKGITSIDFDVDVRAAFGADYDRKYWENKIPNGLHVGDVVFNCNHRPGIIVAYRMRDQSPTCLCLMTNGFLQINLVEELEVGEFDDDVVLAFAEYDQLGAFFSGFDWKKRRFVE